MSRDWLNCDLVVKHADMAATHAGDVVRDGLAQRLLVFQGMCHSPIEAVFFMWWDAMQRITLAIYGHQPPKGDWRLEPQYQVDLGERRYRLDFAVVHNDQSRTKRLKGLGFDEPRICVELDGHEFHERTKEQVIYRNERDRALQAAGWRVLHFSGSELNTAPMKCVFEAFDAAFEWWDESERRFGNSDRGDITAAVS